MAVTFIRHYDSPLGGVLLAADNAGLTGLWFNGAKYFAANLPEVREEKRTPILDETARWLDMSAARLDTTRFPSLCPVIA